MNCFVCIFKYKLIAIGWKSFERRDDAFQMG